VVFFRKATETGLGKTGDGMSDPTEKFIRTFEAVVTQVNKRAGVPSSHAFEIEKAARRDGIVRRNRDVLIYIRNVRNALQHPKHRSDGHALHVSESFLEGNYSPGFVVRCLGSACLAPILPGRAGSAAS